MRKNSGVKWLMAFLAAALVVMGSSVSASAQAGPGADWISLTPAEIQQMQQDVLASNPDPGCPTCKVTGQWDSTWESFLNNWSAGKGYQTLLGGKVNPKALSQLYTANGEGDFIILTDADPDSPAEWLTLSQDGIKAVQQKVLDANPDPGCPACKVTGSWDSNWENWLNGWTRGWRYRTLSGGRIDTLVLGEIGFLKNADGKWEVPEGQPNPGEGGNWITLISSDSLKVQQALQAAKPDLFGSLQPTGAWDQQSWAQALDAWGKSLDWKPAQVAPQDWKGIQLLNERRLAPALLDRLGFSLDDKKHLVSNGHPVTAPAPAAAPAQQAQLVAAPAPSAQSKPEFKLGFKALADKIPDIAGQPLEDEHHNPANGDGLQQTTTGLMVWRKADNWTAFTNGSRTWINGPNGVQDRDNNDRFPWEAQ